MTATSPLAGPRSTPCGHPACPGDRES